MDEPYRVQQIRQFVITATSGSFQSAAVGTFRSQAAVSAAMRHLEQQVGGKLFEQKRRATLTPLGLALLPLFESFLSAHDRLQMDVRHLARAERGAVSLGVVPFLTEEWLAGLLLRFSKEHPDVRVLATDHGSQQVRQLVANGTIDIGVAEMMGDDPKLAFQPIATDAFGILCAADHPLARLKRARWTALQDTTLIGSNFFRLLKGRAGVGEWLHEPAMVVTSRMALVASAKANAGITIVPQLIGPLDMTGLAFVPLESPRVTRTIGLITRRGESLLPAASSMLQAIHTSLARYCRRKGVEIHDGKSRAPTPAKAGRRRLRNTAS